MPVVSRTACGPVWSVVATVSIHDRRDAVRSGCWERNLASDLTSVYCFDAHGHATCTLSICISYTKRKTKEQSQRARTDGQTSEIITCFIHG